MSIGERIRKLRKKNGLSQAELGETVGVESNTISRWERNDLIPKGTSLARVARALNTTSAYLLEETNDPSLPRDVLSIDAISPESREPSGKRLIIKNRDMYVDLPETSEGFEMLRRFFDMQTATGNGVMMSRTAVQA